MYLYLHVHRNIFLCLVFLILPSHHLYLTRFFFFKKNKIAQFPFWYNPKTIHFMPSSMRYFGLVRFVHSVGQLIRLVQWIGKCQYTMVSVYFHSDFRINTAHTNLYAILCINYEEKLLWKWACEESIKCKPKTLKCSIISADIVNTIRSN